MERKTQSRVGLGLVFWAWTALLVLVVSAVPLADFMAARFGGGMILVRPWMQTHNTVLAVVHLGIMLCVCFGVVLADRSARSPAATAMGRGAIVFFAVAAFGSLAMLLFPLLAAPGPWKPDATEVVWMRVLVFVPLIARTMGFGLLTMGMFAFRGGKPGALRSLPYFILVGLIGLDLALSIWKWIVTPKAVIVLLHPLITQPYYLLLWTAAGILFLGMLRTRQAKL